MNNTYNKLPGCTYPSCIVWGTGCKGNKRFIEEQNKDKEDE
jgi:hypothetical protein